MVLSEMDDMQTFEFLGCFHHGSLLCFCCRDICPLMGITFEEPYAVTEQKLKSVYGVQIVLMREHNWREMKKSHPRVKGFLLEFDPPDPLSLRQALYGGRT